MEAEAEKAALDLDEAQDRRETDPIVFLLPLCPDCTFLLSPACLIPYSNYGRPSPSLVSAFPPSLPVFFDSTPLRLPP